MVNKLMCKNKIRTIQATVGEIKVQIFLKYTNGHHPKIAFNKYERATRRVTVEEVFKLDGEGWSVDRCDSDNPMFSMGTFVIVSFDSIEVFHSKIGEVQELLKTLWCRRGQSLKNAIADDFNSSKPSNKGLVSLRD